MIAEDLVQQGRNNELRTEDMPEMLEKNAAVLFALIPDESGNSSLSTTYERFNIEKVVSAKLADIAKIQDDLASFLNVGSK